MADLTMKRKMLFAERMMYNDGISPFNGLFPLKIQGTLSIGQLNHALKRLQEKHPILATAVTLDEQGMPWFESINPRTDIPVRIVERSTDTLWQEETVKEWNTGFDTQNGPLIRTVWIRGEKVSELLLVFHHCMCDGGSAVALVKELLLLMDQPDANIGTEKIFTKLEDVVPATILRSRRKIFRAKFLGKAGYLLLHALPLKKKAIDRGKDYLLSWKLTEQETADLISNCKTSGVTVNTVISLAVLSAFEMVRGKDAYNKITCPVEIRKYAPGIKEDAMFAFGLMLVLSMDKTVGLDFVAKAKKMQELATKRSAKLNAYDSLMMFEYAHPVLPRMIDFLKYGKSTNDCMFSNMGLLNIPYEYSNFTIETIFSPSVIGPLGNPTTLIASTFRKQLDFSFVSSERYIPYTEAVAIKETIMSLLQTMQPSN